MTERELVKACLANDRAAQKELFDQFSGQMMAVCLRYAGNPNDAADMMQEGFIKVFEKLGQYKGEGALGAWMRRIMVNSALIHIRKEKRHAFHDSIDEAYGLVGDDFNVLNELAAQEIIALVAALPTGYRTVFNLYAIEGYSHKEIAEKLEISESTSKTQFHKAKIQLRAQLKELENDQ